MTAKLAREGDTTRALRILQDFVESMDHYDERNWKGPVHLDHARFIADAFAKIIRAKMRARTWSGVKWNDVDDGDAQEDANLALGIKSSKPGRPPNARTFNDEGLAAAFNLLVFHGLRPEEAKEKLRERIGCDKRTVENADAAHITFRTYRRAARNQGTSKVDRDFAVETIKVGAEPYQAQVAEILSAWRAKGPNASRKSRKK